MKRSEMIKIVQDAIYQAITAIDIIVHEEEASDILKTIERAGMLPPPDDTDAVTGRIIYAYYNERVESDDDCKPIISKLWEPEDG